MPLNVLVVGAGVCGPAFAAMLQAFNHRHKITVVERAPALRATGQQIDLKAQVIPIIEEMSLVDLIKAHSVAEKGLEIVDTNGKSVMRFDFSDKDDKGEFAMSVSSEYEIVRGDLVKVLYEYGLNQRRLLEGPQQKEGGLKYEFGKSISEITQAESGVDVSFSDGQKDHFDLIVGADGQGSKVRRLAFGQEISDEAFKPLNIYAAFYSVPRIDSMGDFGKSYLAPGHRAIMTRTGDRSQTQVFLLSMTNLERIKASNQETVDTQKKLWSDTFKGAGWESERLLAGLKDTNDFYTCELAQIKMEQWYKSRVVLLGDAGYCPSVMTGMGTTSSLIGSYVLAGELSKHGDDVSAALAAYGKVMRPYVAEHQKMPGGGFWGNLPSSRLGIWLFTNALWAVSKVPIGKILGRVMPKGKEPDKLVVPKYGKMHIR